MAEAEQGSTLLALARGAIAEHLGLAAMPPVKGGPWLEEPGATFVTLIQRKRLRGCIGTLSAHRPLHEDIRANAVAAGFRDPRFPPLTAAEFEHTQVEVSLLSPQQAILFDDEADALAQLQPGIDGVVLQYSRHRATFLPQVWQQLPDPRDFMAHLKAKAGLRRDFWSSAVKLSRYTVDKWHQADFADINR